MIANCLQRKTLQWVIAVVLAMGAALSAQQAHAAALNYPVNTTVTVNGNNYVILADSKATSLVIGATTLTVTVPTGQTFTLRSTDRHVLATDLGLTQNCTGSLNELNISGGTTVVITPNATTTCTILAGGGGGGSGGGGGGGGSTSPASTPAPGTSATPQANAPTSGDNSTTSPFSDVIGHFSKGFVEWLYDNEIVQGRSATTFEPDSPLTRAEMVKIALLTFGYDIGTEPSTVAAFGDTDSTAWYSTYVAAAKQEGIVGGYEDGTFRPNAPVTRAEALKIILTAAAKSVDGAPASPFTDVPQSAWFAKYVNFAFAQGVVSGKTETTFDPNGNITRGEMAKIAVKTYDLP